MTWSYTIYQEQSIAENYYLYLCGWHLDYRRWYKRNWITKIILNITFDIKDLDKLKYFLGTEFAYSSKSLFLSQRKYALDLLNKARKINCRLVSSSVDCGTKFSIHEGDLIPNVAQFQRMVGKLIYLILTRSDISYAVSLISQAMHNLRCSHIALAGRILQYIKCSPGLSLMFRNYGHLKNSSLYRCRLC